MAETAESVEEQPTPAAQVTNPTAEIKKFPPIHHARVKQSEYARNLWTVTVPEGTPLEAILEQSYWQHVAVQFKRGDRIEVTDDRMTHFLELIVMAQDRLWCHCGILREVDLTPFHGRDIPVDEKLYAIDYAGLHHKYRVLFKGDLLKDGFESEGLARRYAANHQISRQKG